METIIAARTRLVLDHPWWAALALKLDPVILGDHKMMDLQTAATDGTHLFVRPQWWASLNRDERVGVLIHESLHCGLQHHTRQGARDTRRWNIAADHAINLILLDAGIVLPNDCLADPQYGGLTAEEIYLRLPPNPNPGKSCGEVINGPGTPSEEAEWQDALASCLHDAARAGKLTATTDIALSGALKPTIPWRELLAHHLSKVAGADDYSWARLSRRKLALDALGPASHATMCGPLVIIIDTSGSMSLRQISTAVEEVRAAIEQIAPTSTIVIYSDASVCQVDFVDRYDYYAVTKITGGGGTDFRPAITSAEQYDPVAIVYLTDGDGIFPQSAPEADLVWIISTAGLTAPIGTTINLPRED